MPNPIKQFIEESGTSVVAKFSREDDGLLDLSKYDGDILEKEVISQQLALVEKIKEMIEEKIKEELKTEPVGDIEKTAEWYKISGFKELLQDLTIK
jgi:hypothetical protein